MKYFLVLVFAYLTVLFVLSSCDKRTYGNADDDYCPDDDNAFEDMKAWYYFKEGTYWIYEEQNTGQLDTVIVYSNQENQFDTVYQFEWYASSSLGNQLHQWVNTSWSGPCPEKLSCTCQIIFQSRAFNGQFIGENAAFSFPHINQNWIGNMWPGGRTTIISVQDSLEISQNTFYSVVEFYNEMDAIQNDFPSQTKFAKNIGMIESKIPALNENWHLIEYGINQ